MNKSEMINLIGTSAGSYKNKYNRAQKLIDRWDSIEYKMNKLIERGRCKTDTSRLAYIILLIMATGIRVGNVKSSNGYVSTNKFGKFYNKEVKTYGAITLLVKHITKRHSRIWLNFLGKKQVQNKTSVCNEVLLKYYDNMVADKKKNDRLLDESVNWPVIDKFVRRYVGRKFSAKDLRTAKVNLMFIEESTFPQEPVKKKSEANKILKEVLIRTAERAGHTPTVCKGKYVSPDLLFDYKDSLLVNFQK